jgi:hypothetical protein
MPNSHPRSFLRSITRVECLTARPEMANRDFCLWARGGEKLNQTSVLYMLNIYYRSGKSSISSVVFHKLPPSETLYLETTYRIKKESMQYVSFLEQDLW